MSDTPPLDYIVKIDHYVTAVSMNQYGATVVACRCGWLGWSHDPMTAWNTHRGVKK